MDRQDFLIEAAQCIWEAYLFPAFMSNLGKSAKHPVINKLGVIRSALGVVELRGQLRKTIVLQACIDGYNLAVQHEYPEPFDLEFCPWFLLDCLAVNENEFTVGLLPNWQNKCIALGGKQ